MRFRHPTFAARVVFALILGVCAALALIAAIEGWWFYFLASTLLAVILVVSAPFVLGRGWKPLPPPRTRRPVKRRRR